jgi:outer membrane protein OmpA-like peptidoglycan-associated protein
MKQNCKYKRSVLAAVMAIMSFSLIGQDFLPFSNDNYAGITGVHLNPASIANSRYIVDISLVGVSIDAYNNYLSANVKNLFNHVKNKDLGNFKFNENLNGKNKWANVMASGNALNFMFSVTPKIALGFTGRVRLFANMQNFDENIATMFYNGRAVTKLYYNGRLDHQYTIEEMSVNLSAFAEYGVTLAGVLWESKNKHHFLKAGLTGKILQGLGSMYLNTKDLVLEFYNMDSIGMYGNAGKTRESEISYGMSDNLGSIEKDIKDKTYRYDVASKRLGVGFDIGFVYEWRPDGEKYMEEMDCKIAEMKYKNKYKLRIGLSVTDIGWITYKKSIGSHNLMVNGATNLNTDFANIDNSNGIMNGINQRINELIDHNPAYQSNDDAPEFRTTLPTAVSLQVDYHIWKGFYLNFTPFVSLYQARTVKDNFAKIHSYTVVSLTPRFEHKWFGLAIPLQYNQMSKIGFALGVGVRLGPLWIGTNDLIGLCIKDLSGMNLQAALKIPIMYKRKRDRDGDHISDRKDKCPDIPGVCEYQGCPIPDKDGDGVLDKDDECPDEPGVIALKGCPDSDKDGVADKDDECPDMPGLPQFKGCPDSDGDGIPDKDDACPEVAGIPQFNGCPDTDGDGIPDKDDACPDKAGPAKWNGCPDSDGDGIPDHLDACPNEPGIPELQGCPDKDRDKDGVPDGIDECPDEKGFASLNGCPDKDGDEVPDYKDDCPDVPGLPQFNGCPDSDGDGIPDHLDACPDEPGPADNNGCPKKVPIDFANQILFETGKVAIVTSSYPLLDSLVSIMNSNPECYVTVDGHTDNVGNPNSNMILSQKRANAIKGYLLSKGIAEDKVVAKGYGDTKPVADNKIAEGRAKNRRTEINLVTPWVQEEQK